MTLPAIAAWILLFLLQSGKPSIQGVVVRNGTGEPVAGAEVKLTKIGGPPVVGVSDKDGRFVFEDLDA